MSFKDEIISGTAYTAIAKYLSLFISLGVSAILSRLLTPEDYGVIAIAMVIIGFITLLTSNGLGVAIIQNKTLSKTDINHIFTFTIYLSIISSILFCIASPLISNIYSDNQLLTICLLLSINIFFSLLNIVPNALLFKDKKFKYLAVRTIIVQVVLGIISVFAALSGAGIYALLINPIIGSILLFAISYANYKIPFKLQFEFEPIKRILPYSIYQIGFNISNYFYRNIDKLLIGRYMGLNPLGYYEKSYRLMMMPLENISNVINPVLHPILCEHQNDFGFIFDKYKKCIRYFAYIGFLLSAVSFFCARDAIIIVFGPQWEESVSVFRIFSLSIGIQLVQSAVGSVFQSTGHVKQLFFAGIYALVCVIIAIIAGIYSKNLNVLSGYVVMSFYVIFFIYHYFLIIKVMKESMLDFLSVLIRPIISAVILGVILGITSYLYHSGILWIDLIVKCSISFLSIMIMQQTGLIQDIPSLYAILKKPFIKHG